MSRKPTIVITIVILRAIQIVERVNENAKKRKNHLSRWLEFSTLMIKHCKATGVFRQSSKISL